MVTFKSQPQKIISIAEFPAESLDSGCGVARPAHDVAIGRFLFLGQTEGPHIAIAG